MTSSDHFHTATRSLSRRSDFRYDASTLPPNLNTSIPILSLCLFPRGTAALMPPRLQRDPHANARSRTLGEPTHWGEGRRRSSDLILGLLKLTLLARQCVGNWTVPCAGSGLVAKCSHSAYDAPSSLTIVRVDEAGPSSKDLL